MTKTTKIAVITVLAISLILIATALYLLPASQSVWLDVNPSIELRTNRLNRVVEIVPLNDDAAKLLNSYKPTDRDLDDVIEDIVDRMILTGYIMGGTDNAVLISAKDDTASAETMQKVNDAIATYVEHRRLEVEVFTQTIQDDANSAAAAEEHNMSAGKYALIEKLLAGDEMLTVDDLSSLSIKDLVTYANDKSLTPEQLDNMLDRADDVYDDTPLEDVFDRIDDADDYMEGEYSVDLDTIDDLHLDDVNDLDDLIALSTHSNDTSVHSVPDAPSVPDYSTPDVPSVPSTPDYSAPDVASAPSVPSVPSAPDYSVPDYSTPDVPSAPSVPSVPSVPDYSVPDYSAPSVPSAPDYSVPDYSTPDYSVPDYSTPDYSVPDAPSYSVDD